MFSSKQVKPIKNVLNDLSFNRIPNLQRKFNLLKNMFEKVEGIYSFDQMNELFAINASDLLRMRCIVVKLKWQQTSNIQQKLPAIFVTISDKLNEMIKDKERLEQDQNLSPSSKDSLSIIAKYKKEAFDTQLIHEIDIFMHIFREMMVKYEFSYNNLELNTFIEKAISSMQFQLSEFNMIYLKLKNQLDNSTINNGLLLLYKEKRAELEYVQSELNHTIDSRLDVLEKEIVLFKSEFKGKSASIQLVKDGLRLTKVKDLSADVLKNADDLESSPSYRYSVALSSKNLLMRQALQLLKEEIMNDFMLKCEWSKHVKSIDFGCFFVGGSKIQLNDDSSVIVPHGIASLYKTLQDNDLYNSTSQQIETLFNDIKACAQKRLKSGSMSRHDKTKHLYQSIMRLESPQKINSANIIDFNKNILGLRKANTVLMKGLDISAPLPNQLRAS